MLTNAELFVQWLDRTFGEEDTILQHECPSGGPPVSVFVYRSIPEAGMITGVTYGLSTYDHPDWKLSRPELIVSLETTNKSWAYAAAFFAAEFRGKKRFCYGDVFTTDAPLADDTKMDAFLIFAQSLFDPEDAVVQLNDYKVTLSQLYPIYRSEISVYEEIGLKNLWHHKDFGIYDPRREPISIKQDR